MKLMMTPLTTCPQCECPLHDGVCWMCDYATPVAPPARPSLASLFAAAQDHEDALRDMWTSDLFLVTLERDFPTVWHSDEIAGSQVLGRQWHFCYDGVECAVTWEGWPARRWLFQAWDSDSLIAADTSEGYLSAPDTALLVFIGAAVANMRGGAAESEAA
jgi:hypothetical protein